MRQFVCLIIAFWPLAALGQAPNPGPKPAPSPLESIKAEEDSARKTSLKYATPAEARAAYEAYHAKMLSLMDRALKLARLQPGETESISAAVWVVMMTDQLEEVDIAERGDAAFRILADAPTLDDPGIIWAMAGIELLSPRCPEIEPFLRSVLSRSRERGLVSHARFFLGFHLAEMARMHDRLTAPISGPELTKALTKNLLERFRAVDCPKLRDEAEALLEQVVREGREDNPKYLGAAAAGELYRIRHLRIGQAAPELIGEDIDGVPIRLSDFRGKVVVLSFWPTAPAAYMLKFQEQDLVAAMKGRPFVLLGANTDATDDRAKVKEAATQEGITWRSFWAGGRNGAILRKWYARCWRPTVYTIDAVGIIRDDQVGDKLTPAAFEPLVREAEKAAR